MSSLHPHHWVAQTVGRAAKDDPRVAWSENLLVQDRSVATDVEVASTWIELTLDYAIARTAAARVKAEQQRETPRFPDATRKKLRPARFLDDADPSLVEEVLAARRQGEDLGILWPRVLAGLPKPAQAAIVHSPAKLLHWHLLPAAHALRAGRAVSLALSDTVIPRCHPLPDVPMEQAELMWLFSHEGLYPGRGAITVLETDEFTRGRKEPSPDQGAEWNSRLITAARWLELPGTEHGGVAVVNHRDHLLETVYQTAFVDYIERAEKAYAGVLAEYGIRVDPKRFYAAGIVALTSPGQQENERATAALSATGKRIDQARAAGRMSVELAERWDVNRSEAQRVGREVEEHINWVVDFFTNKPGYDATVHRMVVKALGDPETGSLAVLKSADGCCLKTAGAASEICNNCYRIRNDPGRLASLSEERGQTLVPLPRGPRAPQGDRPTPRRH